MTLPLPVAGPAGPALALDAPPLRVLACGSVDDGKSTLIGRIIYDLGCVPEDQVAALERDSKRYGTAGGALDFALLLDGLEAEREQGITIDVAYRYFQSPRRAFIVADAPGHEQYTRNMATGASHCEVALILADARKGVLAQTRRHSCIASLLGIRHVVLAVNKMDLVGYAQDVFDRIVADYTAFVATLGFASIVAVPVSASKGDNVVRKSGSMPWYAGPALIAHLEATETSADAGAGGPFRFPVQWVNRPDQNFRGYAGTVAGGRVAVGDGVAVARSGMTARIARIVTMDGDRAAATAGAAVTLVLDREVDASRGDVLAAPDNRPEIADQFAAHLVWFGEEPLLVGRQYLLKTQNQTVPASVTTLKHRIEIEDLSPAAARTLAQNDIGVCNLSLSVPVAFDPYAQNRSTGSFILIDRFSNATVGAGMIQFGLRRATNIHVQKVDVDKAARALLKRQAPACLWFTGLSGAGKSTIANLVERQLLVLGHHTYLLDGDNVRHGLNRDLGFTQADRVENVRRVAEVTRLMLDAGLIVLVALISPYRAERQLARDLMAPGEFVEIHVDAPIALCRQRDPKGLYRKADEGLIKNFTGVDSAYEPPLAPELVLHSDQAPADALAESVLAHLRAMKAI